MLRFFDDTPYRAVALAQQLRQQFEAPLTRAMQQASSPNTVRHDVLLSQKLMDALRDSSLPANLPTPALGGGIIKKATGVDTLTGGNFNDLLLAGQGNDTLNGGEGNDWLFAGTVDAQGNATLNGNGGFDVLIAGVGNDTQNGNGNNDWLFGLSNNDTLNGNEGDDRLIAGNGNNTLNGNAGNDTLVAGPGDDTLNGNEGDDTFVWGLGDGSTNLINDSQGDNDRLLIKQGVTAGQLLLGMKLASQDDPAGQWRDLVVGIAGSDDSVTINNQFAGTQTGVETIELWDGKSVTYTQLNQMIGKMQWAAPNVDLSDLKAIEANPTLRAILAEGLGEPPPPVTPPATPNPPPTPPLTSPGFTVTTGNDAHTWTPTQGNATLQESGGNADTLTLGASTTPNNLLLGLELETQGEFAGQWRNLLIGEAGSTHKLRVANQFAGQMAGVEALSLSTGQTLSVQQLNALVGGLQWHAQQGDAPTDLADLNAIANNATLRQVIAQAFA